MAMVEDHIVPVRIDIEHDHHRIKDTFMWNCADTVITPDLFAQTLCEDFQVPPVHFKSRIVAAIQERVKEYQDQVLPILTRSPDLVRGKLDLEGEGEGKVLYEVFRRVRERSEEIKTESGEEDPRVRIAGEDEEPMSVEEVMASLPPGSGDDLRILIKVSTFCALHHAIGPD